MKVPLLTLANILSQVVKHEHQQYRPNRLSCKYLHLTLRQWHTCKVTSEKQLYNARQYRTSACICGDMTVPRILGLAILFKRRFTNEDLTYD